MTRIQRTAQQQERDEDLMIRLTYGDVSQDGALAELRQRYGVCAAPDCDDPIIGRCDTCGSTLCQVCLTIHESRGCPAPRIIDADPLRALPQATTGAGWGGKRHAEH